MKKHLIYYLICVICGILYASFFLIITDLSISGVEIAEHIDELLGDSIQTSSGYLTIFIVICTIISFFALHVLKINYLGEKRSVTKSIILVVSGDLFGAIVAYITHFLVLFYWLYSFS